MGSLLAVPSLKVIKTHDYSYVNRTVIVFSSRVEYQIENNTATNTLVIKIPSAAKGAGFVEPRIDRSQILHSILVSTGKSGIEISIQTAEPVRREEMRLDEEGYKLVLDIFPKNLPKTFEAGLGTANFYFATHQFAKALPLYVNLESTFPDKKQVNYYIAKDLAGLKKYSQALARLEKVPADSREYQFVQTLKDKIQNDSSSLNDFFDSDYDSSLSQPVATQQPKPAQAQASTEAVTFQTVKMPKPAKPSIVELLLTTLIPLWLALALIIVLFIIIIIILKSKRSEPKPKTTFTVYNEPRREPSIFVDEEAKRKTIVKLIHDGWSNKEIAKELHISESEVEATVKLLSVSDF